jgi:hypothetical protein
MKLHALQLNSFLALTSEGQEAGNRISQILLDIDANRSVKQLDLTTTSTLNPEARIVRSAIAAVDYAEQSALELVDVTTRRKMHSPSEYLVLVTKSQELGLRLYRNLWELTLSDDDQKTMRGLIKKIAQISVWEDLPAPAIGLSYEKVINAMTGVVAYNHAYGLSFVAYENGEATMGWTVLRNSLENTVILARSEPELAARLLAPVVP